MRKLSKTLALVGALTPLGAGAVGVGEIELHSALNQNLNAEIPLLLSPGENIADVRVSLAPPEAYDKAGLQRHFFLTNIKFEPVVKKDGHVVVKLTTREAVTEPFLNLLVQVDWPQGSMYREFTVLVDPPAAYRESFIPSATAAAPSSRSSGAAAPTPSQASRVAAPVPKKQRQPATRPAGGLGAGETVTVARNDTLWNIARRVEVAGAATPEQVMIALFKNNPNAFFKDNVNALKAGAKLQVPEQDVMLRLSPQEARAEYARQNAAWSGKPESTPTPAPEMAAATETGESKLKLLAPTESQASEKPIAATTAPKSGSEADLAVEMLETVRQENEDLRGQVTELEEQLQQMQKLLVLKDEQLAAMQEEAGAPVGMAPDKVMDVDAGARAPESAESTEPESAVEPAQTKVTEPAKATPPKPSKPAPVAKAPQPAPPVAEESDTFSYLAAGGIGLLVAGLLGLLIHRRKKEDETDTESILSASSGYRAELATKEELSEPNIAATTYAAASAGESSFLSEFTPSDFDAFETDQLEVDPISEADVYLAYGRYKQAEDLIKHSIEAQPERDEFKLKLLEIYYANEDGDAFESYAQTLQADKQSDSEFWEKVVEMGRELRPDSALFVGRTEPVEESEDNDPVFEVSAPSADESDLDPEMAPEAPQETKPREDDELSDDDRTIEFDLSSFDEGETTVAPDLDKHDLKFDFEEKALDDAGISTDYDFDLDLDEDAYELDKESAGSEEREEDEFDSLTDMDEVETKLDLAKAYVQMNDADSARSILVEVIEAGNETQTQEAQELMQKLG